MMKPKRKDSPITTGSFRLFVRHVPTRSPIGDMASSAPSVKSIIPASKSTAPKRKQSRMLEEMGAITKQSTSTIAMIGSTACSASFHFSRSFFVIPNIPLSCLFEADIPFSQNPPCYLVSFHIRVLSARYFTNRGCRYRICGLSAPRSCNRRIMFSITWEL